MNLWTKRTLYLSCFLIFFILAPLLILYTQGYRYNQTKEKIEATGVFYIKSYPRGANIFINNVDSKKTTPDQINNILSSFYDLTVSKDGYFPWQKTLFLPARQTVFSEDIALFKTNPNNIFNESSSLPNFTASTNHQATFWKKNNGQLELWLFDAQTEKAQLIAPWLKTSTAPKVTWSSNNQRLLLEPANLTPMIIKVDGGGQIAFNQLSKLIPEQLSWDDQDDNFLYFTNQNKLYRLDLLNKTINLLFTSSTQAFVPNRGSIWYLTPGNNALTLSQWKERTNQVKDWLIIPNLPGWQLTTYNNIVICYNQNTQTAYLLEENSDPQLQQPAITVLKEFKYFQWYGSHLLYGNQNQINLFDLNTKENRLIIRTTDTINNFFWHPNGVYYLKSQDHQLVITELDERGKSNSYPYPFAPAPDQNVVFNKKGDRLFVIHQIDKGWQLSGFEMQ
ncbi:MAG: PEGA domain-containing protein [Candidatus Komeilibacteria bacterium]|nr:PEGA domain-containing protein [Candidatus Komeilibacteria bacterium]